MVFINPSRPYVQRGESLVFKHQVCAVYIIDLQCADVFLNLVLWHLHFSGHGLYQVVGICAVVDIVEVVFARSTATTEAVAVFQELHAT